MLRAFRLDATKLRYRDWDDLMEYCRYSAAPVGRQLLDLHGEARATWPPSDALCSALQVLNHLQDCAEDYRALDRVYLPQRDLAACGARVEELAAPRASPALRAVIDRLLDGTDALIARARALAALGREPRLAPRMRRHRPARPAPGPPPAPRRSAGIARQAAPHRLRRRVPRRLPAGRRVSALLEPRDDPALREAIRAQVVAAGTSFYWAMRLLPPARREAMFAVYAYCRVIDDIADSDEPEAAKLAQLGLWRDEVAAIFAGAPRLPLARVLASVVAQYGLRQADFLALIDGMEMDARAPIAAPEPRHARSLLRPRRERGGAAVGAHLRR